MSGPVHTHQAAGKAPPPRARATSAPRRAPATVPVTPGEFFASDSSAVLPTYGEQRGAPRSPAGSWPRLVEQVLASPGRALPDDVRTFMENGFARRLDRTVPGEDVHSSSWHISHPTDASERQAEHLASGVMSSSQRPEPGEEEALRGPEPDFARVRLHTGPLATNATRAVNASAFTVGQHVVLGAGAEALHTPRGSQLLAHELAHVSQSSVHAQPRLVSRQARDAGPDEDPVRSLHVACVIRLGGCTQSRDGGPVTLADLAQYNAECRSQHHYTGPDVTPSDEECRNPPSEPLTLAEKLLIAAFVTPIVIVGAGAAIWAVVAAATVAVPVVIAGVKGIAAAGAAATAFYYANAIVVNEIGLFVTGVILSCEGNVAGLLRAIAEDPVQAAPILAEAYMLKTTIAVKGGPPRRASVPVSILPSKEQTVPGRILVRTRGAPVFEEGTAPMPKQGVTPAPESEQSRFMGPPRPPDQQGGPHETPRLSPQRRLAPRSASNFSTEQARLLREARESLRPEGSAIVGVLITPEGEHIRLQSGGGQGFSSHVEGKATKVMRERGIPRAILLVESEPCQICDRSTYPHGEVPKEGVPSSKTGKLMPLQTPKINTALPRDIVLVVVGPESTGVYTGVAGK